MSCRRADRIRLVGCRIGDVAMRGCSRGCCPYPDSEISRNIRQHLVEQHYPPKHKPPLEQPEGRTGLYYRQCMSSYRPKFICPEKSCRCSIKPVYDPDKFEYDISEFQDWVVRPLESHSPEVGLANRNARRLNSNGNKRSEEVATFNALKHKYFQDPDNLTKDEWDFLRARDPGLLWREVLVIPRWGGTPLKHTVRCTCGKDAVRVGSNFRIPKRKDEKAWKEIENMIEQGEDMVARFSFCPTIEDHKKMVERALEIRLPEGV